MSTDTTGRMPALYIGHGAPPLLDDPLWSSQLATWARDLPRPKAILIVSAHWESAPLSLSANHAPLVYDFGGFAPKYYQMTYETPDNSDLAARITAMMPKTEPVHQHASRGLDHGAWVPLKIMYPKADIPVVQMSMPTHDPGRLMEIGRRLQSLRDEGVLIIGSGFLTHGLPFLKSFQIDAQAPGWSKDFDAWAGEAMARGDVDELASYRDKAPGMPYAHPTVEHYSPLFVTLGAATDPTAPGDQVIDGFWMGLSKRSLQIG
ncbi:class III extradiol ring-cleavage dioxygenase [Nocardioides sp. WS12]|uniref:dioxygenase family protein n=1 Tax=Nocardioides sp. WS12 TaxID=2486272 RepID=UPI001F212146|nr:class III extradiol ring-cleavage dioxygenase [Nocardioides sp. WS12]